MSIYWADLHNHNSIGYGEGSLERSFALARARLDVYAFTPHGWWADIPHSDASVTAYHEKGFAKVAQSWDTIVSLIKRHAQDGHFVTLLGHEWHSSTWGDYCLFFPGGNGELLKISTFDALAQEARRRNLLMIPHHCAYPRENRGTNWSTWDPKLSPVVEIFSEHGNSLESEDIWSMQAHSMGGNSRSQTVLNQLAQGKILGFTAGTDNHYGHPGSHGEGLTALIMDSLSEENIYDALRKRHTYAVTGERMLLTLDTASDQTMGDWYNHVPDLALTAQCQAELDYVELFLNGQSVTKEVPLPAHRSESRLPSEEFSGYIRLELGWAGMKDTSVTQWNMSLRLSKGSFGAVHPYFSSGPDTLNSIESACLKSNTEAQIEVATTRTNTLPNQVAILQSILNKHTVLTIDVIAEGSFGILKKQVNLPVSALLDDDSYIYLAESYAVPKIKVHRIRPLESLEYRLEVTPLMIKELKEELAHREIKQASHSSLFFKIRQKNGHTAWTSPLFFT